MENFIRNIFYIFIGINLLGCSSTSRTVPLINVPTPKVKEVNHNIDIKTNYIFNRDLNAESCAKFVWFFPFPVAFVYGDFGISYPFADIESLAESSAINKSIDENTDAVLVRRKFSDSFMVLPWYSRKCVSIQGKSIKYEILTDGISSFEERGENIILSEFEYGKIIEKSRDTEGCLLFGSCPKPLLLPQYDSSFKIKKYKRIYLSSKNDNWKNYGIEKGPSETVFVVFNGWVKVCQSCSKTREAYPLAINIGPPKSWPRPRIWSYLGANENGDPIRSTTIRSNLINGEVYFHIKERNTWPSETWLYKDNSGSYTIDVFVYEGGFKEFQYFYEKVKEINKGDLNIPSS